MSNKKIFTLIIVMIFMLLMSMNIPTTQAAASEGYGLAHMLQFERLPYLKLDTISGGFSSHDRDGGNEDGFKQTAANYLYVSGTEKVMADLKGKGCIYRMWFTVPTNTDPNIINTTWIKVYFDGETTPRINKLMKDIFAGNQAPFLYPLVANFDQSSGGYVCYLPLPYNNGIKITTIGTSAHFFYNIGYETLSPDTPVTTWTSTEDSWAVRNMWNNAGLDPKNNSGNVTVSGNFNIGAGATKTLLDVTGPRSISAIKLNIPGVVATLTDNGRAHKGYSQFRMAINSNNQGVTLKRRLDFSVANQKAGVYVDGAYAGDWYTAGSDNVNRWRDSTFFIPASFTAGKTVITVKIQFVSAAIDWNEFYYWAYCGSIMTDTLDIGNPSSESAHSYVINTQTFLGVKPSQYSTYFFYPKTYQVTDDGRSHKGYSQFIMAINPVNDGVILKRRVDFGIANQKAGVYVDGAYAGEWYTAGSDTTNRWRDSSFIIPQSFTYGKSSITVKIEFVSSANDWNEFTYWTYCGGNLTDTLDVGNTISEVTHSYTINTPFFSGAKTFTYPWLDNLDLLNNTWIKIYWDGSATPSVNAPLGDFFAMGHYGAYGTKSLAVGMDANTGTMYIYFPMPFASRAKIDLVNARTSGTTGITYEIKHKPFTDSFTNVGYFNAKYTALIPTTAGRDMLFCDLEGSGTFVGVVDSRKGRPDRWGLEGDERIYIDDSKTPQIYGTGSEDFYNGGWYFNKELFTLPSHGYTMHMNDGVTDISCMYRLFLSDAIPFKKHLKFGIEHGLTNDVSLDANLVAFYYLKPATRMTLTDTVDVGNAASESSHGYTINTQTWTGSNSFKYEGDDDNIVVTDSGRAHKGYSQFNLAIDPSNTGVMLRRMSDYGIGNQRADVYVGGVKVGTWYIAGSNTVLRWREDEFLIPASFTGGKSSITVKIQFVSSNNDWNEFKYMAYSLN